MKSLSPIANRNLSEYQDITQHETHALKMKYNLADAHTHQSQSKTQQKNIINKLPKLWKQSEDATQAEMEEVFLGEFLRVAKQEDALEDNPPLLVYASSIAMVITANYLMKENMSVSLITPCFDNLHDIMKHMKINMEPLLEEWLTDPDSLYDNLKKNIKTDALFIVDPNNPTGHTLFSHGDKAYKELIRYAQDHDKLLIFDYCFAAFVDHAIDVEVPPVYKLLNESGVRYIAIEDTGKTWPLQDTKVAMIKVCKQLYDVIYNIHSAYLLNVSPFILNVVTQYILDSEKDNFASVYGLLNKNRELAREYMKDTLLEFVEPDANVSVAWFKITDPEVEATELQKFILNDQKVYVLPGTYFFWDDPKRGERFIRVALARDSDIFTEAIQRLRKAVDNYQNKK
jgi:aspartate/methionine/tyrosine aminotransferase